MKIQPKNYWNIEICCQKKNRRVRTYCNIAQRIDKLQQYNLTMYRNDTKVMTIANKRIGADRKIREEEIRNSIKTANRVDQ